MIGTGWISVSVWVRWFAAALFLALSLQAGFAGAQQPLRGVALVVGLSDYENLTDLPNPAGDARAVDKLLSDLGFDVDSVIDRDSRQLSRAIDRFEEDAEGADVALLYYAGHGVEAGGENFLVPTDAGLPGKGSASDFIAVGPLLEKLQQKAKIVILLLDACRTNPFPDGTVVATAEGEAPVAAIGLGQPRGAVSLRGEGPETLGAVVGYAAEPGKAALDGQPGAHSPYAAALLKHVSASGYEFGDVMTMVSEEVYLETDARQLPWTNASLRRLLYFGLVAEQPPADEKLIADGRRALLLTVARTPGQTRQLVEQVASSNAVPLDALYGMLGALGVDPTDGNVASHLNEGATRLRAILAERDTQTRQDPEIIMLAGLADTAESEGAMALALQFRERASRRAAEIDAALDEAELNIAARRLELAATFQSHGDTAILNFDFATAAQRYGDAFKQAERWDKALAYKMKVIQGDAFADLGNYRGDNAALERAIVVYEEALALGRDAPNPRRDAALKGNMAIVMTQLGNRSTDATWLDRASAVYAEIASVLPRKRYPEDWAYTQLNRGNLLQTLADRTGDAAYLDQALKAFRGAAEVFTRKTFPEDWAGLQLNIGNVQISLSETRGDPKLLRQAEKSLDRALSVWTRERDPVNWALAQTIRGTIYNRLGTSAQDAALLRRSIEANNLAMQVATRERQPIDWAGVMTNMSSSYLELALIEEDPKLYAQSIAATRAAREVYTREVDPNAYAISSYNEGRALLFLGRHDNDLQRFEEARIALAETTDVMSPTHNPILWARARSVLGEVLFEIGTQADDRRALVDARTAFEDARTTFTRNGMGDSGQGFWAKQIAAIDARLGK